MKFLQVILSTFFIILITSNTYSQCTANSFQRLFSGTGTDRVHSVEQTSDLGFIVAGETDSYGSGGMDWLIIKLDQNGLVEWKTTIGHTNDEDGLSISIKEFSDGSYVIVGETQSFGSTNRKPYIVKLSALGTILWDQIIAGGTGHDYFRDVEEASNGDILLCGGSNTWGEGNLDHLVVRLSNNGVMKWAKAYGSGISDFATGIMEVSSNQILVTGLRNAGGDYSGYLMMIDSLGSLNWAKDYDGGTGFDAFYSSTKLRDGNILSVGTTDNFGAGGKDFWLMKSDLVGNTIWSRTYGGSQDERCGKAVEKGSGNLLFSGLSASFGLGSFDMLLVQANNAGGVINARTYGGANSDEMEYYGEIMDLCEDSGVVMVGSNSSMGAGGDDMYLVKTDECFYSYCNGTSPTVLSGTAAMNTTSSTPGSVVINGTMNSVASLTSSPSFSTLRTCDSNLVSISNLDNNEWVNIYPNPVKSDINIEINDVNDVQSILIVDGRGKLVEKIQNIGSEKLIKIDLSSYSNGMYFLLVFDERGSRKCSKIIKSDK